MKLKSVPNLGNGFALGETMGIGCAQQIRAQLEQEFSTLRALKLVW